VLELSLIENLQRTDLNAIEEAQGYARLAEEFGMKQEEIARRVAAAGPRSRMRFDCSICTRKFKSGYADLLSVGHAKVLLGVKAVEEQLRLAETVCAAVRASVRPNDLSRVISAAGKDDRVRLQSSLRRRSLICRTNCASISAPTWRFITGRNAAGSRLNTTATTICSASWALSV